LAAELLREVELLWDELCDELAEKCWDHAACHSVSLNDSCNCSIVDPYTAMAAAPTLMRAAGAAPARLRKILIPVDDSVDSEAALEWLLENLHQNTTDELHFLHVLPYCAADFYSVYGVPPVDYVPTAPSEQQGKASVAAAEK
jgi:hypothetical protein